ncbi:MAG: folate family ECF transporter S component [Clostridiales bacterium]|nr:folate family ECF transporter S component [Clostridiales bacterium]
MPYLQKNENAPPTCENPPSLREFFAPNVFTPKAIAALAALLAIRTILGLPLLTIYIGPGFKLITFAYITDALTAMFFGPVAGIAFGFAGDLLGFLASTGAGGAYFPGFAISEIVTCFLFACFFYRRKITVPRVIAAWLLNLAIVLLGLNSLWLVLMYGWSAGEVFALARVVNNTIQSPIHIFFLYMLLTRLRRLDRYLH